MPQCSWRTVDAGDAWFGTRFEPGAGLGATVTNGRRSHVPKPRCASRPRRLRDMDAQGVDAPGRLAAHAALRLRPRARAGPPARARRQRRDRRHDPPLAPTLRAGHLPLRRSPPRSDELERTVNDSAAPKGAELDTVVNGAGWDEPRFRRSSGEERAEAMGAVLFFHPQLPARSPVQGDGSLRHRQQPGRHRRGRADRRDSSSWAEHSTRAPIWKIYLHRSRWRAGVCFGMGRLGSWMEGSRRGSRATSGKPPSARISAGSTMTASRRSEAGLRLLLGSRRRRSRGPPAAIGRFVAWHPFRPSRGCRGCRTSSQDDKATRSSGSTLEKLLVLWGPAGPLARTSYTVVVMESGRGGRNAAAPGSPRGQNP